MNTYLLASSILNFLAASIQIVVLLAAMENNPVRNRYLWFLTTLAGWAGAYTLWRLTDDPSTAYFYSQVLISFASIEPVAFFHFCLALSGLKAPRILAVGYALTLLLIVATAAGFIVNRVEPIMGHEHWPMAGKLMPLYLIHFSGYILAGIFILIRGWRTNIGGRASDHMLVLFSVVIGSIGGATNFPLWYGIQIQPYGNILVSIYLFLMLHGIYKKRIFGLSINFYKLLVGLILNSSVTLFVMVFYSIYRSKIGDPLDLVTIWIDAIYVFCFSVLVFWIVPRVKYASEQIIEGALRSNVKQPLSELTSLSSELANIVSEESMFSEVTQRLQSTLKVSWVAVFQLDFLGKAFTCRRVHGKAAKQLEPIAVDSMSPLAEHLRANPENLLFDQIYSDMDEECYKQLVDLKYSTGTSLIVPIHVGNELSGMLLFGPFDLSKLPSNEEMTLLANVGSQIGMNLRIRDFQRRTSEVDKLVALGTMAAGLSHEIRNPLVSVQTMASMLKDNKSLTKLSEEYKDVLIRDIRRIESIVDGVASYSKNEKAHNTVLIIQEVIESSIDIYRSQAEEHGVRIHFKDNISKPVSILGNSDQLVQVFNNLIENAIQALEEAPEREIIIETQLQDSARSSRWVGITVTDTGEGVPASIMDRIFDPFITSKDTGQRENKLGMGLGLAISKRIVENHDGLISVINLPNGGARFTVSLHIHNR